MGVVFQLMCLACCVLSAEACTELRGWLPYPPPGGLQQTMPLPEHAPAAALCCLCRCLLHHQFVVCEHGLLSSPEGSLHPRSMFARTADVAHQPVDGCCAGINMQAKGTAPAAHSGSLTLGCLVNAPV